MELSNEFTVEAPIETAWAILTDVETIAPCLPGAQLKEIDGDEYRGTVKVKVGPITAQYKGAATFEEKDDDAHRAVIRAEGRDTRGQGNASAMITATMTPAGDAATSVSVATDLTVTGKVAQFGRGVMADVSANLMEQFADNLSETVLGAHEAPAADAAEASSPGDSEGPVEDPAEAPAESPVAPASAAEPVSAAGPRVINQPEAAPVDLMAAAGTPVAKRVVPVVGALVVIWLLWRLLRGRG